MTHELLFDLNPSTVLFKGLYGRAASVHSAFLTLMTR